MNAFHEIITAKLHLNKWWGLNRKIGKILFLPSPMQLAQKEFTIGIFLVGTLFLNMLYNGSRIWWCKWESRESTSHGKSNFQLGNGRVKNLLEPGLRFDAFLNINSLMIKFTFKIHTLDNCNSGKIFFNMTFLFFLLFLINCILIRSIALQVTKKKLWKKYRSCWLKKTQNFVTLL